MPTNSTHAHIRTTKIEITKTGMAVTISHSLYEHEIFWNPSFHFVRRLHFSELSQIDLNRVHGNFRNETI